LGIAVMAARKDVLSPLHVNVVSQIAGRYQTPEFVGVRTGRYSAKHLLVQAALVPTDGVHPDSQARELLRAAVSEAERWARERGLADSLRDLHFLVDRVTTT
jgi:plasmid stability protein